MLSLLTMNNTPGQFNIKIQDQYAIELRPQNSERIIDTYIPSILSYVKLCSDFRS